MKSNFHLLALLSLAGVASCSGGVVVAIDFGAIGSFLIFSLFCILGFAGGCAVGQKVTGKPFDESSVAKGFGWIGFTIGAIIGIIII